MEKLMEYLPFLIPIIIVELALLLTALLHVLKHNKYRFGNRVLWIIIVVFFQVVGPIFFSLSEEGKNNEYFRT